MAARSNMTEECFFKCSRTGPLITGGLKRINTIISSSVFKKDVLHIELRKLVEDNPNPQIQFHKTCVSSYTSSSHIQRELKRSGSEISPHEATTRRKVRADHSTFTFQQHCLICGDVCLPKDSKNPSRWRRVVCCRTLARKKALLEICAQRHDDVAEQVHVRIHGAITDLHAADAQYHYDCYVAFVGHRNIAAASRKSTEKEPDPKELALEQVIKTMEDDPSIIWNSLDIYDVYCKSICSNTSACSERPSTSVGESSLDDMPGGPEMEIGNRTERAELLRNLEEQFGKSLIVLRVDGCASILCFRQYLPEALKLVEANDNNDIASITKQISSEIKELKTPQKVKSYNLGDFTRDKAIESSSQTLLNLVSSLVSKGAVTRESLPLTQSIQALMTKNFNQTTLGLAVKLHYRFGSREVIDLLHANGYIASYDEVLRFRKSAAIMTGESEYAHRDLFDDSGLISCWCDNFDLQVYTPNGCRETHAMAIEFVQHTDKTENPPLLPWRFRGYPRRSSIP